MFILHYQQLLMYCRSQTGSPACRGQAALSSAHCPACREMPLPVIGDVSIHEHQGLGRDLQGLSRDQTETLMSGLDHDGHRSKLAKFLHSFQLLSTGEAHAAQVPALACASAHTASAEHR